MAASSVLDTQSFTQQLTSWSVLVAPDHFNHLLYARQLRDSHLPDLIKKIQKDPEKYLRGSILPLTPLIRLALERIPRVEVSLLSATLRDIQSKLTATSSPIEEIKPHLRFTARHLSPEMCMLTTPLETIALRLLFLHAITTSDNPPTASPLIWLACLKSCINLLSKPLPSSLSQTDYFRFLSYSCCSFNASWKDSHQDLYALIVRYKNSELIACSSDQEDSIDYLCQFAAVIRSLQSFQLPEKPLLQQWFKEPSESICEQLSSQLPVLKTELKALQSTDTGEEDLADALLRRCDEARQLSQTIGGDLALILALINSIINVHTIETTVVVFFHTEINYWNMVYTQPKTVTQTVDTSSGSEEAASKTDDSNPISSILSNVIETLEIIKKEIDRLRTPEQIGLEVSALESAIQSWEANSDLYLSYTHSVGELLGKITRNKCPLESPQGISGGGSIHDRQIRNLRHAFSHLKHPVEVSQAVYTHEWHQERHKTHPMENSSQRMIAWIVTELFSSKICKTDQQTLEEALKQTLEQVKNLFHERYATLPFDSRFAKNLIRRELQ